MNIKELETLTGVTKQNIRFYEKKGLLTPDRNPQNDYREYTEDDVAILQTIKMFRKLEISIEDIRRILNQEVELGDMIEKHLKELTDQQSHLKASIEICRQLTDKNLESLNVLEVLEKMQEIERRGGKFMDIIEDYKKVVEYEGKKEFSFVPDTMALTPREFTDALLQFANENNLNITITKESMYPRFLLDGIEYEADRVFGRLGAVIRCHMVNPEEGEAWDVPQERREKLKLVHQLIAPVIMIVCVLLFWASRQFTLASLLVALSAAIIWIAYLIVYRNIK